jgi:Icc-related predicted phosphoesterase
MVSDLIDNLHPALCVVGGPAAGRGSQRLAGTLVVNPGYLAEGSVALVDWTRPAQEEVEFLDLREGIGRAIRRR